jgi:hypothetical protein
MSFIPEMADALLATGGVFGICFVVLVFADQMGRLIRRF